MDHVDRDDAVSRAVVVWTGYGSASFPSRSEERLIEEFGSDYAVDLLPRVKALHDSFYLSDAINTAADLDSLAAVASADFREIHPEISDPAVQALAWCYTWDYK